MVKKQSIHLANGTSVILDSREVAGAAATWDMYEGRTENATYGPLSVAVPAEVKGLHVGLFFKLKFFC